jgi:hypothetical protein
MGFKRLWLTCTSSEALTGEPGVRSASAPFCQMKSIPPSNVIGYSSYLYGLVRITTDQRGLLQMSRDYHILVEIVGISRD